MDSAPDPFTVMGEAKVADAALSVRLPPDTTMATPEVTVNGANAVADAPLIVHAPVVPAKEPPMTYTPSL